MGYIAEFIDGTQFNLFDSTYFNDKAIFNLTHQLNLTNFSVEIIEKGIPRKISDEITKVKTEFQNKQSFEIWFKRNQSTVFDFGFADITEKNKIEDECIRRIDLIIDFLEEEILLLKTTSVFSPWRINGGYIKLENLVLTSLKSIEVLESKNTKVLKKTKQIFETLKINTEGNDLISYSKMHDLIEYKKLLHLCESKLKKIKNLNKKKWWMI